MGKRNLIKKTGYNATYIYSKDCIHWEKSSGLKAWPVAQLQTLIKYGYNIPNHGKELPSYKKLYNAMASIDPEHMGKARYDAEWKDYRAVIFHRDQQ
jgi:hypothetical protein